jgi:4-coumarate--CoA ligase
MQKPTFNSETKVWSGRKFPSMYNPDQNLGHLILSVLKLSPDAITQVSADTGVQVTCGQMRDRIEKFARHLVAQGLKQGDVVGVVAGNSENVAPAVFACFLLGLPVNPLAPIMLESDIAQMFEKTKPKLVLCDGHNLKVVQAAVTSLKSNATIYPVMEDIEGYNSVTKVLNKTPSKDDGIFSYPDIDSDTTALIMVSSGSTSAPKGICKTHREIICCINPVYDYSPDETPVTFQSSPMFWFSGFFFLLFSTLFRSVRVITSQPYHPKTFSDILIKHKVSLVLTPPFLVVNLIQSGLLKPLEHMRCWMIGGSAVTKKLIDTFQPFVPSAIVTNTYACTEANVIAINFQGRKVESCGQPDPNLQIKVRLMINKLA